MINQKGLTILILYKQKSSRLKYLHQKWGCMEPTLQITYSSLWVPLCNHSCWFMNLEYDPPKHWLLFTNIHKYNQFNIIQEYDICTLLIYLVYNILILIEEYGPYNNKVIDWVWGQHVICWTWRQKCCPWPLIIGNMSAKISNKSYVNLNKVSLKKMK